ncbi:type II toxin-antitoxin system RelE/ParE family toxin [Polyangium sp. y55x31]|uniref:type II toxin-antitoxin system RelE/ParE family toxin n=1 Tax=Polyangium sp. y55x31 TaxID=3042688 RepID=UPI00248297E2|nr:type II toxin-antitoxin system RelE/ParE family toxin [Polyangium sp. y55x31]MDI1477973.1 type II toxin-antitoxin system RelE/ParE family toxin [Polyangium sp. y55x31]
MVVAKPVEFLPAAVTEAEEAAGWYAEKDPRVAVAFSEELERALRRIEDAPGRWPSYLHGTRRVLLRRFPFCVVYREEPSRVIVVAVAHTRRSPDIGVAAAEFVVLSL